MSQLIHPEIVAGRRLWLDPIMSDLIDKLHHGDSTIGWEGDPRLAVYWNEPRWEVWRLEDDGEYRMVCRSAPGVTFDERLLVQLCQWDVRRRRRSLHDEIVEHNDRVRERRQRDVDDYMTEEALPRLRHAMEGER